MPHPEDLITQAEAALQAGNEREALNLLEQALQQDPQNTGIYEKLIATHESLQHEWSAEDFSQSLNWTLLHEAALNPELVQTQERVSPEYQQYQQILQDYLNAPQHSDLEQELWQRLSENTSPAQLVLLDFIAGLKAQQESDNQ